MLKELQKIQNEYLLLLKNALKEIENHNLLDSLDSVRMFWFKNRNVIIMASDHLFKYHDTFFLTAATIFDVNDYDQNIFCVNGDYQIFDDPIPSYLTLVTTKDVPKETFGDYLANLEKIIIETIQDEIVLLEEKRDGFFVLPLRYFTSILNVDLDIVEATKQFVQSFFNKTITKEVLKKEQDLEELINHEAISSIILFDEDNPKESITTRVKKYIKRNEEILPKKFNNLQMLYFALMGDFQQAFNVLEASLYFNAIPFFRSFTPYNNYYIISQTLEHRNDNLDEKKEFQKYSNKSFLGYLLYHEYYKRDQYINLSDLKQKAKEIDLSKKIKNLEPKDGKIENVEYYVGEINRIIDELTM